MLFVQKIGHIKQILNVFSFDADYCFLNFDCFENLNKKG